MRTASSRGDPVMAPFTVVIDTREQAPFSFQGIRADSDQHERPMIVPTVINTLKTGDYSILGLEDWIVVERKSHEDLYGTLINGIERFERELDRMRSYAHSAIVIECGWGRILQAPELSEIDPKCITRQIMSLMLRFPQTHWITCPDRRFAEAFTFQLLRKAHKHWKRERKSEQDAAQGILWDAHSK